MDTPGVRHLALAGPSRSGDMYLCDVFTPCMGYVKNALNNTRMDGVVTCFECLSSTFEQEVNRMNLEAIDDLDEPELYEHMIDRDAMAPGYEFDA
jgi:hypothetical protein